jgi:hypothetical protein
MWTHVCDTLPVKTCMWHTACEHMYVTHYLWTHVCDTLHVNTCMWHTACEHMYVTHCMWTHVCDTLPVNTCMWHTTCEHMYVTHCMWTHVCDTLHVNTGMWHTACEHTYVTHCMWTHVCDTLHVNTCMWHTASEHMYVTHYLWTHVCDILHVNTCMWHTTCEHMYVTHCMWTHTNTWEICIPCEHTHKHRWDTLSASTKQTQYITSYANTHHTTPHPFFIAWQVFLLGHMPNDELVKQKNVSSQHRCNCYLSLVYASQNSTTISKHHCNFTIFSTTAPASSSICWQSVYCQPIFEIDQLNCLKTPLSFVSKDLGTEVLF